MTESSHAYYLQMSKALPKIVALVTAVVLALPPGLCCGMDKVPPQVSSTKTSCCHRATAPAPDQRPLPVRPKASCCCSLKAATPTSSVRVPDAATVAASSVPLLNLPLAADLFFGSVPFEISTGPPLHALLCNWRC